MRIGLARRGYSATGGAENYLRRLATGLECAGHECVLFADPRWPRTAWTGAHHQSIKAARSPRAFANAVATFSLETCDVLLSLERVWRCDCYRAGDGVHRAWLARRARLEPRWQSWARRWTPKHRQLLALETSLFAEKGAKTVIANSCLVRDEILEHYGYSDDRIAVIHNGLPKEYYLNAISRQTQERRVAVRTALKLEGEEFVILFVGSGWERKGLRAALEALELLLSTNAKRRVTLLVAGKGHPQMYLGNVSRRVKERVRFLGPVSDVAMCYDAADLFLLPTLYDPFANACLEALGAGLPVITTRSNGFGEIIEPGVHGEVLDETVADFPATLANALGTWIAAERAVASRDACRARAAQYTIDQNITATMTFLGKYGIIPEIARLN